MRASFEAQLGGRLRLKQLLHILLFIAGGYAPVALAQDVHSTCVEVFHQDPATCVVSHPKILNIYWDTSATAWDADAGPQSSHERIDAHSLALTRSTYFSQLQQYHISAPEFLGGVISTGCPAPPHGHVNLDAMANTVRCVRQTQPDSFANVNLVAIFVPPQTEPQWISDMLGFQLGLGVCETAGAFHLLEPGMPDVPIAFIPLACNHTFPAVLFSYTHELVEAMSDPEPLSAFGYVDTNLGDRITFGTNVLPPEIGDLCENTGGSRFLDGLITQYWSQTAHACVPGFAPPIPSPNITGVQVCGSGKGMQINVTGTGFGPPPPDVPAFNIPNGTTASSVYFAFGDTPSNTCPSSFSWEGGHAFDPQDTGVRIEFQSWSDTAIQIGGFGGNYGIGGKLANPGDPVMVVVNNKDTGLLACATATIPSPAHLGLTASAPFAVGDQGFIQGVVRDAGGCGEDRIDVTLTASAGTLAHNAATDPVGNFQAAFTAPQEAGPVIITATIHPPAITRTETIPIAPIFQSISPPRADISGGTVVTIAGRGFVPNQTALDFGANNPQLTQVQSSAQLTVVVPSSHEAKAGDVAVDLRVRGVPAAAVRTLTYFVPFGPLLRFSNANCGSATLTAQVFDHSGNPVAGEPVTLTAMSGQFQSGGSLSATLTLNTNASGEVTTKMVAAGSQSGLLSVAAHTAHRPSPDETGSVQVIAQSVCQHIRNFQVRTPPIRIVVNEFMVPTIIDGCEVCNQASRYRLEWLPKASALKWISVAALTNDASFASRLAVEVLGAKKAAEILKRAPAPDNVLTMLAVQGDMAGGRIELQLKPEQGEKFVVYQLQANRWVHMATMTLKSGDLSASIKTAGTIAVMAAR
jgi:hypothetical protein